MKKRIISAIAILALMFGAAVLPQANAQIFVTDNEEAVGVARNPDGSLDLPAMPILDVTYDQMAPLGEGLLLLTAMGGLYLMGKRRKDGGFYALPKKHVIPTWACALAGIYAFHVFSPCRHNGLPTAQPR